MSAATINHLDPTQVQVEIEIESKELEGARERAFRELVRNVRVPGFRPGKVPRKIFESQYGSSEIEERALNAVVPPVYSRALEEHGIEPVDQPHMEVLPIEQGEPLRVRAVVAVRPQIELHDYKGMALHSPAITIEDDDVTAALEELRTNAAVLVPVERPVELGDVPTIDYEGKIDGEPFEGGHAEGQATEMSDGRFIPGFAAGIVGMSAGQTKEIQARFPDDYGNAPLAGKTATFTVTVHENKIAERPQLDDEFAKRFGDTDATLDALRDDVRNRLEANARSAARRELTKQLLGTLIETHDVPVPAVMVDRETQRLRDEAHTSVERLGLSWDDYLSRQQTSDEELAAEWRAEAARRVKTSLLVEAIAKAEQIVATSADIEAEVRQLSEQYRRPPEAILEMLRSNWSALVDGIVRTKTIEFLLEKANVTQQPLGMHPSTGPGETESGLAGAIDAPGKPPATSVGSK